MRHRGLRIFLGILGISLLLGLFGLSRIMCLSAYVRYGIAVGECPAGTPRVTVEIEASGLRRGSPGSVWVEAPVFYTTGPADELRRTEARRFDVELSLVRGPKTWPLAPKKGWEQTGGRQWGEIVLPEDLEDGDYVLRAKIDASLGEATHEVELPVYAPARIHTLTDRPLYEPGNTIRFRAVVLRARDLSPLEGRPGKFVVTDPNRLVVMEQPAPTGPFGVASADLPLDPGAPTGTWWVAYESGGARDPVSVRVEPFTLPRFTVEASPARPFYTVGEAPIVRGRVTYSSGAPVTGAKLELAWSSSGAWPPPTSWKQGGLPRTVYVDDAGRFELRLPRVPGDLVGQAVLQASIRASDPTGDQASGGVQVLLSKDRLTATAVTELDGGLVDGFNNRVYLRVATADGRPLPDTDIVVRRAWDATDEGEAAKTDADGVAALQLDPGPAVNVLVPAPPVRPPPRPEPVRLDSVKDLVTGQSLGLGDQVRLEQQQARLAPCARFVEDGSSSAQVGLRVSPRGAVTDVTYPQMPLERCLGRALRGFTFASGGERIFETRWTLTEDLPRLSLSSSGVPVVPDALSEAFAAAALDARRCLPEDARAGKVPARLMWTLEPGRARPAVSVVPEPSKQPALDPRATRCVTDILRTAELDAPMLEGAQRSFGLVRMSVVPGPRYESAEAPDRTKLGYELEVRAAAAGEDLGRTTIFLPPGQVPNLRLRATPVLARPGETVELKVLRGPGFVGTLPEELYWRHEGRDHEVKLDEETRTARFTVPEGAHGWFEARLDAAKALVFVRPSAELSVEVRADREVYPPGARAKLSVFTTAGGAGTSAAVGLFGVDQTLGQLARLPGPDAMDRLVVHPSMRRMAFGALDAQALSQGRVQGPAASAAIVTLVRSIPSPEDLDRSVSVQGAAAFDPVEALTDGFYRVLGALYAEVREWERAAPKDEVMRPAKMAELWQAALTKASGESPVEDAYGRPLRLSVLPDDLLALADPRAVVVDGTRLPEDVDNWIAWVRKERP